MIDENASFGYFFMQYKVHKPEKNYPGRIKSGCGSPTERLSSCLGFYMKPLMEKLSHTAQFLRKLEAYNKSRMEHVKNKPVILCTWDIEAMYINITNQLSIEACRKLLNERAVQEPSTEAIEITLEENIAQFDCIVVKQRDGTAMGPYHECLYADIAGCGPRCRPKSQ